MLATSNHSIVENAYLGRKAVVGLASARFGFGDTGLQKAIVIYLTRVAKFGQTFRVLQLFEYQQKLATFFRSDWFFNYRARTLWALSMKLTRKNHTRCIISQN
jgi:hypothetical protein